MKQYRHAQYAIAILKMFFYHAACVCPGLMDAREKWWACVTDNFDLALCAELCSYYEFNLYSILLGRDVETYLNDIELIEFRFLNFRFIKYLCGLYNLRKRLISTWYSMYTIYVSRWTITYSTWTLIIQLLLRLSHNIYTFFFSFIIELHLFIM